MNILVSPGWGPGTKVSFKGAIKQFTYSLSEVKHRIHYNEKLVKISHPARRVTATNVSKFQYLFKMEKHNNCPWYKLKFISLWLSRNNELWSREQRERSVTGPVWESFIKAWIQIAVPDSDHRDEASHDLDPQISATVTSAHHDVSPPSMHHTAAQSWFSFYNGMVSSIELDIEWRSHALSQPVSIPDGLKRFVSFTTSGSSSSPTCELTIN